MAEICEVAVAGGEVAVNGERRWSEVTTGKEIKAENEFLLGFAEWALD